MTILQKLNILIVTSNTNNTSSRYSQKELLKFIQIKVCCLLIWLD